MKQVGRNLFMESEALEQQEWVGEKQYIPKVEGGFVFKEVGEKRIVMKKDMIAESTTIYENGKAIYTVVIPKKK